MQTPPPKNPTAVFSYNPGIQGNLAPSAMNTHGSGAALQEIPKQRRKVVTRLEVSSYDRNYNMNANTNMFQWELPVPLKDVYEIRIVNGTVPVPMYNIDVGWNSFRLWEGYDGEGNDGLITLTPGRYTVESLRSGLQSALNGLPGVQNQYSVVLDDLTQTFTIQRTAGSLEFGFLFVSGIPRNEFDLQTFQLNKMGSLAMILGFRGVEDVFCDGAGKIVAPNPPWLDTISRIYLYMSYDASIDFRSISRGAGRKDPSAIFYLEQDLVPGGYKTLNQETYDAVIEPGKVPISRIATIQFALYDEFYRLVNTNNRPVSFLLELTHHI